MADEKNWFQQAFDDYREWGKGNRAYLGLRDNDLKGEHHRWYFTSTESCKAYRA